MTKQSVLILGATGETGGAILDALREDGSFEVACLVQPSSAEKPSVSQLKSLGLKIIIGDLSGSVDDLASAITGYDIVISAISAPLQTAQLTLVDAAAKAGTRRFVPCGFITICPPDGVMRLRDDKEVVYQRVWKHHLPYTIIDGGYWHELSVPNVPSGKFDYALFLDKAFVLGDGDAKSLLIDKRDIGQYVARIIKDERTLNQKVCIYSEELSQNEIIKIVEEKTGEKVEFTVITAAELEASLAQAKATKEADPANQLARIMVSQTEYNISKYVRQDNTVAIGKYLGYLDGKELYPEFKPLSFEAHIDDLIQGKGKRPYSDALFDLLKGMGK